MAQDLLRQGEAELVRALLRMDDDSYAIPAANIGDTDLVALARTNPTAAQEIARLKDLMDRGEETKEDFLRLCQLLVETGSVTASEYLLRRNVDGYDGRTLYLQLFGTAKHDEFVAAIRAFQSQFGLILMFVAETDFLVSIYRTEGGSLCRDNFSPLCRPCEIRFGYILPETIEADVAFDPK